MASWVTSSVACIMTFSAACIVSDSSPGTQQTWWPGRHCFSSCRSPGGGDAAPAAPAQDPRVVLEEIVKEGEEQKGTVRELICENG